MATAARAAGLVLALLGVGALPGCFLDRSGTGGGGVDASMGQDAGEGIDGGRADGGGDAGTDAGGCAPGTVDLDLDPSNGCECTVAAQRCEGGDEDCDGNVDEGCDCAPAGSSRGCGADVGACAPGSQTCGADGTWGACEGGTGPQPEACNGLDDDCDGTVDGFDEPCGTDEGLCVAGTRACIAGSFGACSGVGPEPERCDAASADEDCDGMVNEGCGCVGTETRACTILTCAGVETCAAGAFGPCVLTVIPDEECNGRDDDCNGTTDDGGADCEGESGCVVFRHAGGAYLFCYQGASDERRDWPQSRDRCREFGYELATIDDMAENDALAAEAERLRSGDFWIGIADPDSDGTFTWVGPPSAFTRWRGTPSTGQCGVLDSAARDWETKGCGGSRGFICEAPAP